MAKDKTKLADAGFGKLMEELEAITTWLEQEQRDVDEVMEKFERGSKLATELEKRLRSAKQRIEQIEKTSSK